MFRLVLAAFFVLFALIGWTMSDQNYPILWIAHLGLAAVLAIWGALALGWGEGSCVRRKKFTSSLVFLSIPIFTGGMVLLWGVDRLPGGVDLTVRKSHSLQSSSREILASLNTPVQLLVPINMSQRIAPEIQHMLDEFDSLGAEKLQIEYVPLAYDLERVEKYSIGQDDKLVLVAGKRVIHLRNISEEEIVASLRGIIRQQFVRVGFIQGAGELSIRDTQLNGLSVYSEQLSRSGYLVSEVDPSQDVEEFDLLVWASPRNQLDEAQNRKLQLYIESGGAMLVLSEPDQAQNLSSFLSEFGITPQTGVVIDPVQQIGTSSPLVLYVSGESLALPARSSHGDSLSFLFEKAGALGLQSDQPFLSPLLYAPQRAVFEETGKRIEAAAQLDSPQNKERRSVLGARWEGKTGARLIVFSDTSWLSNRLFSLYGNRSLAEQVTEWLAFGAEALPLPRDRSIGSSSEVLDPSRILFFSVFLVLMTEFFFLSGLLAWRRNRALS